MDPTIDSKAALVLRQLILTCGSAGCFESMKRLEAVKGATSLAEIGRDDDGHWRMSVFQRLLWYANEHRLERFEVDDLVRYFGGTLHIDIMDRLADHAGLGQYLGRDVGLVTHVLLPLSGNSYSNGGYSVSFDNLLELNPEEGGARFYHLGAVLNIPVNPGVIRDIELEQFGSEAFVRSLQRLNGQTIRVPDDYLKGLSCTSEKAST